MGEIEAPQGTEVGKDSGKGLWLREKLQQGCRGKRPGGGWCWGRRGCVGGVRVCKAVSGEYQRTEGPGEVGRDRTAEPHEAIVGKVQSTEGRWSLLRQDTHMMWRARPQDTAQRFPVEQTALGPDGGKVEFGYPVYGDPRTSACPPCGLVPTHGGVIVVMDTQTRCVGM